MLDAVRKYVEAGREALTPKGAEDLARSLARQGQARKDQVSELARDLLAWSRRSSDRFRTTVPREVTHQIARSGVATKDDVESLKRRVRKLETAGPSRKSTAGTSSRKKTAWGKKATSRKRSASAKG
jgi:polyhydroxyalkanoate synthesis regulator phasin